MFLQPGPVAFKPHVGQRRRRFPFRHHQLLFRSVGALTDAFARPIHLPLFGEITQRSSSHASMARSPSRRSEKPRGRCCGLVRSIHLSPATFTVHTPSEGKHCSTHPLHTPSNADLILLHLARQTFTGPATRLSFEPLPILCSSQREQHNADTSTGQYVTPDLDVEYQASR